MKAQLSIQEWEILLRNLSAGKIPDCEIGSAIVHLSKPLDHQRVSVLGSRSRHCYGAATLAVIPKGESPFDRTVQ